MKIGYARVSTLEQDAALQEDALRAAGCARVITDQVSGSTAARPGLARLRDMLREGDTMVVWRLDRLGRSLPHLIAWAGWLEERGIGFESLQEKIETASPAGRLTFHLFAALAEFERNLIRERTAAGLAAARARGRTGGRPRALDADGRAQAVALYRARTLPVAEICTLLGISKPTLYAYLRQAEAAERAATQAGKT
ncbi:MAG: recombinase family protein [Pseudomonadota bacterium]